MIYLYGNLNEENLKMIKETFLEFKLTTEKYTSSCKNEQKDKIISFDREASSDLENRGIDYYNWNLLFNTLGPNDTEDSVKVKLRERIKILKEILSVQASPKSKEFHGSIRVNNLAKSSKFYCWLLGIEPKEWTHRYVTFLRKDIGFNFVLLVADDLPLHHDTLYHLGMGVVSKEEVVKFYDSAISNGFEIHRPPRTTWRGTPLHELWLKDPDGTLIEIYARLTKEELEKMPEDKEPFFLVK